MCETEDENTVNDIELAAVARQLRAAFKEYKEKISGRPYKPDKRFNTMQCWKRVAEVVTKLHAVPEEYIRAQFIYSTCTVFANTLHGTIAQKNYKRFKQIAELTPVADTSSTSPAAVTSELAASIAQTETILKEQFGPSFILSAESLQRNSVKQEVLGSWWRFDPVVIIGYAGADLDYRHKFLLPAGKAVVESPCIIKAAMSLGLDLSAITNEDKITNS